MTVSLEAHRLKPRFGASREERLERNREMLSHALSGGKLVAVVGSGCSAPLGYPTWGELTTTVLDRAVEFLKARRGDPGVVGDAEHLERLRGRLESRRVGSRDLMFVLGRCRDVLDSDCPPESRFGSCFGALFEPPESPPDVSYNPHRTLSRLTIRRFLTTNYDIELERALAADIGRDVTEADYFPEKHDPRKRAPRPLSFTQRPENSESLAAFALAETKAGANMVFHCHGRYDDPESIVATEPDYQRWYLADPRSPRAVFLQTIDLLFQSNPVLFVGYGLNDEDLLRPLRRLVAVSRGRIASRPIFALLPEDSDGEDWTRHEMLFERYGLHVLLYVSPAGSGTEARGRLLCGVLEQLEEQRRRWKESWLEKPTIRTVAVRVHPREPYRHYTVGVRRKEILGERRLYGEQQELLKEAFRRRVIGLVGPGGTGKSWLAMRLLEHLERRGSHFEGLFFWSSYYADDSLTGLDRLLAYLEPGGDRKKSRLTRLREILRRECHLIVLDGFERLLRPAEEPGMGHSNDPIIRRVLKIFADKEGQSTLVLTSRLWPQDLDPADPAVYKHELRRMRTDDLLPVEPFSRLGEAEASALCSLLEGHTYALLLAGRFLREGARTGVTARWIGLRRELADTSADRRLAVTIRRMIEVVDGKTGGLASPLLRSLAVFMSPVRLETVETCFAMAAGSDRDAPSAKQVLEELMEAQLLFRVESTGGEHEAPAYTVHPTVRSYVFQQAHRIETDVLPNFTLAGFTSGRAAVHPGSPETADLVRRLFDRLHEQALHELAAGRIEAARRLCRSLFGIVRSRMETNTAPRWCAYDEYIRFGLRVADLARRVSPRCWSFRESHELEAVEAPDAPLYADELAFIYNDVGLTLCAEGYMPDTLAVWEQGYEINSILEGTAEVPLYTLQSQLHLGHTCLEIGDLQTAGQYLDKTTATNHDVDDLDYGGRILGYQALIEHYRYHFEAAEEKYRKALRQIKRAGGNPRAESFFFGHRAKLAIAVGRLDKAESYVRSGRALAEAGGARDLVAYARTVQGRLYRARGSFHDANAEYHEALAEARELGVRRLEAEILCGLARVSLELGDADLARRRALGALALANELGLGLRTTRSLILLGMATVKTGHSRLGVAYLRLAKQLGDEQQYRLRSREAEAELHKMGEDPLPD